MIYHPAEKPLFLEQNFKKKQTQKSIVFQKVKIIKLNVKDMLQNEETMGSQFGNYTIHYIESLRMKMQGS